MRIKEIHSDRGVLVITDFGDRTIIIPINNRDKLLSFMRSNATNVPLFPMDVIDSLADAASHKVQIKMEAKKILTEWPYFVLDVNFRYSKSYDISFEEPFFKLSHPLDDGSASNTRRSRATSHPTANTVAPTPAAITLMR